MSLLRNMSIGLESMMLEECTRSHQGSFAGPTVLEVFNTLLKHLRLSVEFEANDLQGGPIGNANLNTSSKDSDEKIVQNAIITLQSNQCFLLLPSPLDYNLLQDRQPCGNLSLNVLNLTHSSSHIRDISSEMAQSMHHL